MGLARLRRILTKPISAGFQRNGNGQRARLHCPYPGPGPATAVVALELSAGPDQLQLKAWA